MTNATFSWTSDTSYAPTPSKVPEKVPEKGGPEDEYAWLNRRVREITDLVGAA